MQSIAFILVFVSAIIHASWNVTIRHVKGNTPVLVFAHFLGTCMSFPFTLLSISSYSAFSSLHVMGLLFLSTVAHAAYILLLSAAYTFGDVGLVYPLARGTAIVLSTLASRFTSLGKTFSIFEIVGIAIVVCGILVMFFDGLFGKPNQQTTGLSGALYETVQTDEEILPESNEFAESIEMVRTGVEDSSSADGKDVVSGDLTFDEVPVEIVSDRSKLFKSVGFAVLVGGCTATYSIVDAIGVHYVDAVIWSFCINLLSITTLLPVMFFLFKEKSKDALTNHKKTIVLIAPATIGAYLIILYVFSLPGVNVAIVITLREFSVLIGALFGVLFLHEVCGVFKMLAVSCIMVGMVLIKMS